MPHFAVLVPCDDIYSMASFPVREFLIRLWDITVVTDLFSPVGRMWVL
ncbi:hypothetical protein CCP3SC1_1230004 [Gammaproteobacteria bacterium]